MGVVALDAPDGKPTAVPAWSPRDADGQRLQAKAQELWCCRVAWSSCVEQLVDARDG
jgi:hypothetical protein